jgi:hypothetical protein
MTKTQLLCVVAVLAAGAIVAGVAMLTCAAWALVAGGILALVGVGLLYDPAERRPG